MMQKYSFLTNVANNNLTVWVKMETTMNQRGNKRCFLLCVSTFNIYWTSNIPSIFDSATYTALKALVTFELLNAALFVTYKAFLMEIYETSFLIHSARFEVFDKEYIGKHEKRRFKHTCNRCLNYLCRWLTEWATIRHR